MNYSDESIPITVPHEELVSFCLRWKIVELSLFGSAADACRFHPDSDIDLLATFAEDAAWSLLDHAKMEFELIEIFGGGREVDLINRRVVEKSQNTIRRQRILASARRLYSAA